MTIYLLTLSGRKAILKLVKINADEEKNKQTGEVNMVEYILGNYLVSTGKITREKLQQTLDRQDSVRVKLGLIAVAEGMMTLEQADEVNRQQALLDRRFGDIAVSMGFLTDEQVGKLLKMQGNNYLMFMQALVDDGVMKMEEMDTLIQDFRQSKGYGNSEMDALKSDEVDRIVPLFISEEEKEFTEIITTAVRTLVRMIDRHVYVGQAVITEQFPTEGLVSQALQGGEGIVDALSEGDGALLKVCSIFGQEEFPRLDLDALDASGELLNCINGLYASAMSRNGEFLELMPPEYGDVNAKAKGKICRIPIYIGEKSFYFTVAKLA